MFIEEEVDIIATRLEGRLLLSTLLEEAVTEEAITIIALCV